MKPVINFLDKFGLPLILVLFVLNTCTSSMSKKRSEKKVLNELDSVKTEISKLKDELKKEIKIEGLKSERRMIEATDRKIFDLNRIIAIDKELKQLDK